VAATGRRGRADENTLKLSQVATVPSKGGRGHEGGVRAAARELGIDTVEWIRLADDEEAEEV
jgi:hypothetical protein